MGYSSVHQAGSEFGTSYDPHCGRQHRLSTYLQLGHVLYKAFSFLAYSLKSLSIAGRYIVDGLSNHEALSKILLWHSTIFQSDKHLTNYCTALIAKGITKVGHLFDHQ